MTDELRAGDVARTLATADLGIEDRGLAFAAPTPQYRSAGELRRKFPHLRKPVLVGLLREGESMNMIAPAKKNKTFLAIDLSLSVVSGRPFLDTFNVPNPGRVLYIDNELHPETMSDRLPKVVEARRLDFSIVEDALFVESLRGRLVDIHEMGSYFSAIEPGRFKLIILDALYRFFPNGVSENDNASMAQVYNAIDRYADRLGSSFVMVHHASKGSQTNKDIVDVGAGGGSQSRATDLHLVLRPHLEPDAVVVEAANRSWAPVSPLCMRWQYPVWNIDTTLDPTQLKPERSRTSRRKDATQKAPASKPPPMTNQEFVTAFVKREPQVKEAIILAATRSGMPRRTALDLLTVAREAGLIHAWRKGGANTKEKFATVPSPRSKKTLAASRKPKIAGKSARNVKRGT